MADAERRDSAENVRVPLQHPPLTIVGAPTIHRFSWSWRIAIPSRHRIVRTTEGIDDALRRILAHPATAAKMVLGAIWPHRQHLSTAGLHDIFKQTANLVLGTNGFTVSEILIKQTYS